MAVISFMLSSSFRCKVWFDRIKQAKMDLSKSLSIDKKMQACLCQIVLVLLLFVEGKILKHVMFLINWIYELIILNVLEPKML